MSQAATTSFRKTPLAPGERINHWTIVAPVLPAPKQFSQWVYWARPDGVSEARQVSYKTLNNKPVASEIHVQRGPSGHRRGEKHGRAKWPDALVERARELHQRGVSRGFLARNLGVPYDTVRDWIEYRTR